MYRKIDTMAGVVALDQAAGTVEVGKPDATDTVIDLTVVNGAGDRVIVFMDRAAVLELMASLGALVVDL